MGKSFKRILTTVLTLCLVLSTGSMNASATAPVAVPGVIMEDDADEIKTLPLSESITAGDKVWFGGEVWRVIDTDTVANDSTGQKGILLLSEYIQKTMQWNSNPIDEENTTYQSRWDASEIRAYLRNEFESTINLTAAESAAVVTAVKDNYTTSDPAYPHRGIGLTGDRFFLLNSEQALYTDEYFCSNDDRIAYDKASGEATAWWLRSSFNYLNATEVGTSGWFKREDNVVTNMWGVRPAFYLNPTAVVSASEPDADGIKTLTLSEETVETTKTETPEPETPATKATYTVVAGDCLWNIARKVYGNGAKWPVIFEANKNTIKNINLIYVGQKLVIPSL